MGVSLAFLSPRLLLFRSGFLIFLVVALLLFGYNVFVLPSDLVACPGTDVDLVIPASCLFYKGCVNALPLCFPSPSKTSASALNTSDGTFPSLPPSLPPFSCTLTIDKHVRGPVAPFSPLPPSLPPSFHSVEQATSEAAKAVPQASRARAHAPPPLLPSLPPSLHPSLSKGSVQPAS